MAGDPQDEMAVSHAKVRVAVVQAAPVLFDARDSLQKLAGLTADAVRRGADLGVFPEAFVARYPERHDVGVRVVWRPPERRAECRRLFDSAVEVSGEATGAI